MQYPGNQSLPAEIQERILSTFRQTVEAARQGNIREAELGCDFVLKLDPEFSPAKQLQERLSADARPKAPAPTPPPPVPPPPPSPGAVAQEISALVEGRRFEEALTLAAQHRALVSGEPRLLRLVGEAQSRFEAAPLVNKLVGDAQGALREGRLDDLSSLLEKARSLDGSHPALAKLEAGQAAAAIAPPAPSPSLSPTEPEVGFSLGEASPSLEGEPVAAALDPLSSLDETNPSILPEEAVIAAGEPESAPEATPEADPGPGPGTDRAIPSGNQAESPSEEAADEIGDDPFAAFEGGFAGADESQLKVDDDPFAAFASAQPAQTEDPSTLDDDPFAVFAEPSSVPEAPKNGEPEGDQELEEDPFALLAASPPADPSATGEESTFLSPEPAAGTGDDRVQDLLNEGQGVLDQGDYQGAIDVWSRIFLIDIDHEEASQRIEQARKLKAESERQAEEVYEEGLSAWRAGDSEKARKRFERVLALQPENVLAQEHLARLARGEAPEAADIAGKSPASVPGAGEAAQATGADLLEEILVPPSPGEEVAPRPAARPVEKRMVATRRSSFGSRFVLLGAVVLLAVGAAGYYLFSHRESFFPNSGAKKSDGQAASSQSVGAGALERARKLHGAGKVKLAISQLNRMPKTDPAFEEAQALIAEWQKASPPPPEVEGPTAEEERIAEESASLVAEAKEAATKGEFLVAKRRLASAAALAPLGEEESALLAQAEERLLPLRAELNAMADRDWEFALSSLWAKYREAPTSPDVILLIVDCYYNQAIRDLQKGDQKSAVTNFQEALALAPEDKEALRHLEFAKAYLDSEQDLLYRIYVKYLPYR